MNTDSIISCLSRCRIKPSVHRIAVLRNLKQRYDHPTADMIYHALHPEMPTLSKTTVYNVLKLLAEKGAIQTLTIDEKNVRFDGNITPHAHFQCRVCETVYDLPTDTGFPVTPSDLPELLIDEIQLYYKGYCKKCSPHPHNH